MRSADYIAMVKKSDLKRRAEELKETLK